jgi:prepilin-type N-terminal cleavage/methylation domain-containing protein
MQRGFTLIETVVVVAVVGLVAAIGVAVVRGGPSAGASGAAAQQGKGMLLGVRDQAVAQLQCRRVEQAVPGLGNTELKVFHDVDCNPTTSTGDVLLQTLSFTPGTVSYVEVVDNGNFDDEKIQYRSDGSLFDTETTRVEVTDANGTHRLNIQLATGGVVIE